MKYTDRELEDILNKLIASTRSPRGRFSAASSYPQLEKKLNFRNSRLYLTRTFAAAAAVVLLCLSVWTAYLYMQPATIQTVSTLAETRTVHLPDGTSVTLNHYSSLSYPERFKSDNREVELSGEAYFEVAKNPEKRFIVSTSHQSQIEVLGTHFNIEAYEKDDKVLATLVEGKIGFIFTQDNVSKKVLMDPGQKLVYDSRDCKVQLYATSGESETAWKEGKIIFRNTPLEEGLRMLEKRYNVEFIIKNDRLKGDSFTGTFTNQRLERILEYFQLSSQIRWRYLDSPNIKDEKSKIEIY